MRGAAHVRIAGDGPRALPVDIRSEPPFAIRRSGSRILLVSSAAAPVGGDDLALEIDVEPAAHADLGTVAATMVWPSPTPRLSVMTTTIRVGAAARLQWRPHPMVSVAGSEHLANTTVHLAADATATVVEEVALGRHGESSGQLELRLRVERGGRPLVHHVERFGPGVPGAGSVVSVGSARHVVQAVLVGVDAGASRSHVEPDRAAAWLPVADDAVVVLAATPDRPSAIAVLAEIAPELPLAT
jgi:urease accessory protein